MSSFAYDLVPYKGSSSEFIQLRNLEVVGSLYGLQPASLDGCRVLEIGCADGTNLLPHALEFPNSEFVGVDLASRAIECASRVASESKLNNVRFLNANVEDLDMSLGLFDYILCPGVFSWISDDQRSAMMRIGRQCVNGGGMMVVSYNTRPGWNWGDGLRDFMCRFAQMHQEPVAQIAAARNAAEFLAANTPTKSLHGRFYAATAARLRTKGDAYVYHDYLSGWNQPFYFHEFQQIATEHDWHFVGEADFKQASGYGLDSQVRAALSETPPDQRQSVLDYLTHKSYRQSILCASDQRPQQSVPHERLMDWHLTLVSRFTDASDEPSPGDPLVLSHGRVSVTVTDPLMKTAIQVLSSHWPHSIAFEQLWETVCQPVSEPTIPKDSFAKSLLAFYAAGLLRVFQTPPAMATSVSAKPCVNRLVRMVAKHDMVVVNQWHQDVLDLSVDERLILSWLDGHQTVDQIVSLWMQSRPPEAGQGESETSAKDFVEQTLNRLLALCLLVA